MLDKLSPEPVDDSVKHRQRPAPLEDPLRRLVVRRIALITLFPGRDFKGQHVATAALLCAMAVALVSQKELQRSQNKRPEPSLFRVCSIEISAVEHVDEKLLRQILRLVG